MNIKKITVLLLFLVAIIGIIAPVNATIGSISSENKDYTIESKEKTVKYKITWNANGGKFGTKKTVTSTVTKGSKLKKLATTPKRSGYTFNGWYTKKTGGKKVTVNTKPTLSVTLYAQWTKTTTNSKIVGIWYSSANEYYFYSDARFTSYKMGSSYLYLSKIEGKYSVSNGKVYFTERKYSEVSAPFSVDYPQNKYGSSKSIHDMTSTYTIGSDQSGDYLKIANQDWWASGKFTSKKVLEKNQAGEYTYRKSTRKL